MGGRVGWVGGWMGGGWVGVFVGSDTEICFNLLNGNLLELVK